VRREIDEAWIEEAVERHQRLEALLGDFERALARVDVTVRSPDGLVEIVVAADGVIRDVTISDAAQGRDARELSKVVQAAVTAAADAARWARAKLHQDMFNGYPELSRPGGFGEPVRRDERGQ
jgi:DNA-binding protein YbaB